MRHTLALLTILTGLIFAAGQSFGQLTLTGAGKLPSAGPAVVSFDPAQAVDIAFTNTNKTVAKATGTGSSSTRSTTSHTSGKYYVEVTVNSVSSGNNVGAGIVNSTFAFNGSNFVGIDNNGIAAYTTGAQFLNSSALGIGSLSFTTNDVLCIAVDVDNRLIYWRVNGGNWNGSAGIDPATGGGQTFSALGAAGTAVFVAADLETTAGNQETGNFGGSAFAFTAPTGFVGW